MTDELTRLEVGTTEVRGGDGPRQISHFVSCPRQLDAVPLAECAHCIRCERIGTDPVTGGAFVVCRTGLPSQKPRPAEGSVASQTRVAEVMTACVLCVREDLGLEDLAALLLDRNVSNAPVVDGEGRLVGVASKTDVVRACREGRAFDTAWVLDDDDEAGDRQIRQQPATTVADVMMPLAFGLHETDSVAKAAALMAYEGVHGLPVVDGKRHVVGIVSPLDILRWLAEQEGYKVPRSAAPRTPE